MLKNAYFWEKTVKFSSASEAPPPNPVCLRWLGIRPQTSELLLLLAITTLYSSILTYKMRFIAPKGSKNNYSKCSAFASFAIFAPIFTLNSVVFVDRERKNIFFSRAHGTLATPLGSWLRNVLDHTFTLRCCVVFLSWRKVCKILK